MASKNNYYSDGNISNGLKETKYAIKNLLKIATHNNDDFYSDYYKELFNCIDKAIELIEKK